MKRLPLTVIVVVALLIPAQGQTIKRQDVINNASAFQNLRWTMNSRNMQNQCSSPVWIKTNTNFSAGLAVTGMAYCWGSGHTTQQFTSGIAGNGKAGNICTSTQGNCCYRSNTFGVDCSGLVTRAWGRSEVHKGTGELPAYCSVIRTGVAMRMGDIFNKVGDHTAIYSRLASSGNPYVVEASATDWKVSERERSWSYFNNYAKLRYNQLQDGGLAKLNSGISITPSSVRRGQAITVIFHLKELEGASITFDGVAAAVLSTSNQFKFDLPWVSGGSPLTIPPDGEKAYVASGTINLSPGTYKVVARGRIGNWFDFPTVGGGVNGKTFTVTP